MDLAEPRRPGRKRKDPTQTNVGLHQYKADRRDHYLAQDRERSKRRANATRERLHDVKRALGCARCPETESFVLEWHHDPRQPKLGAVSTLAYGGKWEVAMAEAERCILLCANCHKKITWGVMPDPFEE